MPTSATLTIALSLSLLAATPGLAQRPCVDSVAFRSEDAQLQVQSGTLRGTLILPDRERSPLAILLAGSGPTDRDGNTIGGTGRNDSLKLLAEALARRGIASLRYDRRGIGASREAQLSETDFRFPMLADDAARWAAQLRDDPRFGAIAIVGHSEGSLVAILAAQRTAVDAVVTLAGPGRPHWRGIRDQLDPHLSPELRVELDSLLQALVQGRTYENVPEPLRPIFPLAVQPYLSSLYRFDPAVELARLRVPVLVVQGTTDLQVPPTDADSLVRLTPAARVVRIDGMNHVLKAASGPLAAQLQAYVDPSLPVVPELVDSIAGFLCTGGTSPR